ncbi:MAG: hypothetical protein ABFQ89_05105, partial [Chloroflexota bacterium]
MLNHKSKSKTRNAAIWLSDREVWLVAGISPALLSPHVFPFITALALAVIPLLSLLRRAAGRPWMKRTPLNAPFLLLLISVPASLLSSPTSEAAQTSACVLLLGIALFMAAVNSYQPDRKPLWIGGVATLLGLSIALAYFASGTVVNKLTVLDGIAAQVSGISSIVQTGSVSQMDPSMVAGVLALLLPVVSAFALVALRRGRIPMQSQWYLVATIILGIGAVILVALFSTQVRTAIFAVLILMLGTAATRWRGIEALVIGLGVVVVIMLLMGRFTGNLSDCM